MSTASVKLRIERAYRTMTDAGLAQIEAEEAEADAPEAGYTHLLRRRADRLMQKAEFLMQGVYDEVLGPSLEEEGSRRCQGCEDAPVGQHTGPHDWQVLNADSGEQVGPHRPPDWKGPKPVA